MPNKQASCVILAHSLQAWPGKAYAQQLKQELEGLGPKALPLEECVTQGGMVADEAITATVLKLDDAGENIVAKVGIFFTEIVICCGCGDDPMPSNAYCKLRLEINKTSGETGIRVLRE